MFSSSFRVRGFGCGGPNPLLLVALDRIRLYAKVNAGGSDATDIQAQADWSTKLTEDYWERAKRAAPTISGEAANEFRKEFGADVPIIRVNRGNILFDFHGHRLLANRAVYGWVILYPSEDEDYMQWENDDWIEAEKKQPWTKAYNRIGGGHGSVSLLWACEELLRKEAK